jgi:maltose alpha-D-glucosyltransferase / alpha-amylase
LTGSLAFDKEYHEIMEENPQAIIAEVEVDGEKGILYDAAYSEKFHNALLEHIHSHGKIKGKLGELVGSPGKFLRKNLSKKDMPLQSKLTAAEQSNTSILYNNQLFLKIYRSPEEGSNPELEIIRNLTEKTGFDNLPPYAGTLIYKRKNKDDISQAILVGFIPNEGNAWDLTQRLSNSILKTSLPVEGNCPNLLHQFQPCLRIIRRRESMMLKDLTGHFFVELIEKLGQRTAEMHLGLASIRDDKTFAPEALFAVVPEITEPEFPDPDQKNPDRIAVAEKIVGWRGEENDHLDT